MKTLFEINFADYVAKDSVLIAYCVARYAGICLTKFSGKYCVSVIFPITGESHHYWYHVRSDAYSRFNHEVSVLTM